MTYRTTNGAATAVIASKSAVSGAHPRSIRRAMSTLRSFDDVVQNAQREDRDMKHLLTGVAVVAALAFCAPVGAQQPSPSGGNPMGMPGPNPGGPGLTPYTTGPARQAAPPATAAPSQAAPAPSAAMPPSSGSATSSAMPPKHRHARAASHGKIAGHAGRKGPQLTGSTANQLNQEELARLQAGNFSNPSAPPAPPGAAPPPPTQPSRPMGTTGGGAPYRP
jgi:hypothetical protein